VLESAARPHKARALIQTLRPALIAAVGYRSLANRVPRLVADRTG
jgi:hypothetical protein